jgi:hypothetical protein
VLLTSSMEPESHDGKNVLQNHVLSMPKTHSEKTREDLFTQAKLFAEKYSLTNNDVSALVEKAMGNIGF